MWFGMAFWLVLQGVIASRRLGDSGHSAEPSDYGRGAERLRRRVISRRLGDSGHSAEPSDYGRGAERLRRLGGAP
jgi:hypothetical protein